MTPPIDPWHAAGVNPPTPRRSINMPVVNIPAGVRLALYVVSGLGSVVVAYLFAKELIGEAEGALWAGIVALINAVAAANVSNHGRIGRNERGQSLLYIALIVVVVLFAIWLLFVLIPGR